MKLTTIGNAVLISAYGIIWFCIGVHVGRQTPTVKVLQQADNSWADPVNNCTAISRDAKGFVTYHCIYPEAK